MTAESFQVEIFQLSFAFLSSVIMIMIIVNEFEKIKNLNSRLLPSQINTSGIIYFESTATLESLNNDTA